ncbi:MAG TPA: 6-pyruvoyl-tetrahydropterin synthase-related protein [Coleofasciculaceae cyanobacterium]
MLVNYQKRKDIIVFLSIVFIGFLLTFTPLIGGVIEAHDVLFHFNWSKYFSQQFWSGELYPRWLLGMNSGLGSPSFFFYPPIPYYFTSLFYPLQLGNSPTWLHLVLSASLALIASGVAAYIWLKDFTNVKSAFIGSILYMSLPYHLAIDLYWRFAFSEYWSFVWIPLVLYFSRKLIQGTRYAIAGFAISYALLCMTHLPTTLIFSPVPISYVVLMSKRHQKVKVLVRLGLALLLGVGLAAIYLVPALTTQNYVLLEEIASRPFFYYANNFLWHKRYILPELREFVVYLGVLVGLMAGITVCAFIGTYKTLSKSCRRESIYWFTIAGVASLMTLPLSKPIWQLFPILQIIQFPWRFNVVLTVTTTVLVTLGVYVFHKTTQGWQKNVLVFAMLLLIGTILSSLGMMDSHVHRLTFNSDSVIRMSQDASEYRPKWVAAEIFDRSLVYELGKNLPNAKVTTGEGNVSIKQWQPRKIVLQANAKTDVTVTLKQFYYPGWTARAIGRSQQLPVEPSPYEGLLRVKVPSGQYEVRVTLDTVIQERLGQSLSAVSAGIVVLLALPLRQLRRIVH